MATPRRLSPLENTARVGPRTDDDREMPEPNDDPEGRGAEEAAEEAARQAEERFNEALAALANDKEQLAQEQLGKRKHIDDRIIDDLRQYHGRYDADTEARLSANKSRSRVFANITRSQTHSWEARLSDMLFPTDDKNWGIMPTPVPELKDTYNTNAKAAREGFSRANSIRQAAHDQFKAANDDEQQLAFARETMDRAKSEAAKAQPFAQAASEAKSIMDEAKKRSKSMELEIEDQFVEAQYGIKSREVIRDACKMGTGIIKGPVRAGKVRPKWTERQDENDPSRTLWVLNHTEDPRPTWSRVHPLHFVPDMSATRPGEWEFTFELHLPNKKELRRLARQADFNSDAVARLIKHGPREANPSFITQMKTITSGENEAAKDVYWLWEYHGPLEAEEYIDLVAALLPPDEAQQVLQEVGEFPLFEYNVIMWFCQGEVLAFGEHPMESGESLYSVYNLEKDDGSVFGFGVPYLMRDSQAAFNGAWRMALENAGLSAGPQVVIDQNRIEPQNGSWELTPRKVWLVTKDSTVGQVAPFMTFDIPNNQTELMNLLEFSRRLIDDETNLPIIARGEQGSNTTQTSGGMTLLMNSVNVVFRRAVKNFDDDYTIPNVRRAYDWNMAYNPKDEIKGDMNVNARGSAVLLIREIQSTNLMALVERWSTHPVLGAMLKIHPAAKKAVNANMIPADEILKDEETMAQEAADRADEPPPPEVLKIQSAERIAQADNQTKMFVAAMNRDTAVIKMAEARKMKMDDIQAMLVGQKMKLDSAERMFSAEAALEQRRGTFNGQRKASGGFF